jgi:hypothetical protein
MQFFFGGDAFGIGRVSISYVLLNESQLHIISQPWNTYRHFSFAGLGPVQRTRYLSPWEFLLEYSI